MLGRAKLDQQQPMPTNASRPALKETYSGIVSVATVMELYIS
jgi:hypothetical protein